jgi:signal transduction histidine kinase/ActR/RegA family two-component response regulator
MKNQHFHRLSRIGLIILGLFIVVLLIGFQYVRLAKNEDLYQSRGVLAELLLMDSLYREAILRARFGIDPNYDVMAHQQMEIAHRLQQLEALTLPQEITYAIAAYKQAVSTEIQSAETFKSLNATVRNAVRYYQYESRQLIERLPNTPEGQGLRRELHRFALEAFDLITGYGWLADPDSLRPLTEAMASMAAAWPDEHERLNRLVRHMHVLNRNIPLLTYALEELTQNSPRIHLRDLQQQIDLHLHEQSLRSDRLQSALVVVSLFLLLALGLGFRRYLEARADRLRAQELALAVQAAEAANVAKSRFLATMSHEIRTPMNGILGMAQLLMAKEVPDEKRKAFVQVILSSGQTLLTLLNDILDLSKVEAGRLELEIRPFCPQTLLTETLALFAAQAQEKGLALKGQWHGPLNAVYEGDNHRIRQMLSNLISNALKFTKEGQITVEVRPLPPSSTKPAAPTNKKTLLEWAVRDTGLGVDKKTQALLFSPFSQADSSTTRQFGGTGLGLSIVRQLARMMDGEAGLESHEGQGSRFWFTTALLHNTNPAPFSSVPASMHDTAPAPLPFGMRSITPIHPQAPAPSRERPLVFVVEDNAVNQMVVRAMLSKLACEVETAENGREAVERIQAGLKPDLVLMDVQMPEMDGYQATKAIRTWETKTGQVRVPIVALTADAFPEDRRRCREAGMDDFLAKPLAISALQAHCARFIPRALFEDDAKDAHA